MLSKMRQFENKNCHFLNVSICKMAVQEGENLVLSFVLFVPKLSNKRNYVFNLHDNLIVVYICWSLLEGTVLQYHRYSHPIVMV